MSSSPASRTLPPLAPGATIGIVFPAGPVREADRYHRGLAILQELGFTVMTPRELPECDGYLAGDDLCRAGELHRLWANPGVAAVMAARGGYGCLRLLPHLDLDLLLRTPKPLIGFSDVTALHAVCNRAGLPSVHGPVVTSLASADVDSVRRLAEVLMCATPPPLPGRKVEILRAGSARGSCCGGNLATLCSMLATAYDPDFSGGILVLEDVAEQAYRIDRMLTQLAMAGKLERIAGLVLGTFEGCADVEQVWKRALELTPDIPVWGNFPVGHGSRNCSLMLGVTAEMDGATATLRYP
ncbi:MAG: LD-carboxypeptidase [Thermodesulfobacteriota bacterium]